jgi:hypothetical protein
VDSVLECDGGMIRHRGEGGGTVRFAGLRRLAKARENPLPLVLLHDIANLVPPATEWPMRFISIRG